MIMCALFAMAVTGCSSPNEGAKPVLIGATHGISTTGNTRVITERWRDGKIVCTEPSPDYAVAFDVTRKITLNMPAAAVPATSAAAGAPSSAAGESVKNEEIKDPGAGRSQAVMALRDGLYAACQSYANGVIGHDAYAMILSQYGALLVALVSNDATRAASIASSIGTRSATLSALTVACVSSHDRTRGLAPTNSLLTPQFCSQVFSAALERPVAAASIGASNKALPK